MKSKFPSYPQDYINIKMDNCLTVQQRTVIKSFFSYLITARAQTQVKVSKLMLAFRKERNGAYYCKSGFNKNGGLT